MKNLLKSKVCESVNSIQDPQTDEKQLKSQKYVTTVHKQ